MKRRDFLKGLVALTAAPVVAKAKPLAEPIAPTYTIGVDLGKDDKTTSIIMKNGSIIDFVEDPYDQVSKVAWKSWNEVSWDKHKSKIAVPLKEYVENLK